MNCNREIGLHLKLKSNFASIFKQAQKYKIKIFQFFLTDPVHNKYFKILPEEQNEYLKLRHAFSNVYIHSSYWINPATGNQECLKISKKLLKKEIRVAKKFGIKHLIMHAGTAKGHKNSSQDPMGKISGIKTLAKILNNVLQKEDNIEILLENTAHANQTIGSDITDFSLLKTMLNKPEKINFCLDSSHAFAYGYDLKKTDQFINLLDKHLGLEKIKLIHLNDSAEKIGSKLDKHEIPGKGLIGKNTLKKIINHPKLKNVPLIMELPEITKNETLNILLEVKSW